MMGRFGAEGHWPSRTEAPPLGADALGGGVSLQPARLLLGQLPATRPARFCKNAWVRLAALVPHQSWPCRSRGDGGAVSGMSEPVVEGLRARTDSAARGSEHCV